MWNSSSFRIILFEFTSFSLIYLHFAIPSCTFCVANSFIISGAVITLVGLYSFFVKPIRLLEEGTRNL